MDGRVGLPRNASGLSPTTPAIAVQDGTTTTQRIVFSPLNELAGAVEDAQLRSPTLVMIGQVVSMFDPAFAASSEAPAASVDLQLLAPWVTVDAPTSDAAKRAGIEAP